MPNLFNYRGTAINGRKPGYNNRAFFAPLSFFDDIQPPVGVSGADAKTIDTAHTFLTGKGFVECYVQKSTLEGDGQSNGEVGALNLGWSPKFFIPGDGAALQQMVESIINEDILLVAESTGTPNVQFGSKLVPLSIKSVKFVSGKQGGEGKKGWEIECGDTNERYFYDATITILP